MTLAVKICGLLTPEAVDAAIESGADMVGFVFFPPSPRNVSLDIARTLGTEVRGRAQKVALTVDADDALFDALVKAFEPDLLQLHGKEQPERIAVLKKRFGLPVMKAIAVEERADVAGAAKYVPLVDRLLFDARAPHSATRPGGLGKPFDWHLLQDLHPGVPFMLPAGSMRRMSPRRCASLLLPASTCLPEWSASRGRRILVRFAPSCVRLGEAEN